MTAERLAKNFERMVITSERLKKFSNGRPERLNGRSNISNGWSWTAERLVKNFERMVITAERLKKISNGRPERLNGTSLTIKVDRNRKRLKLYMAVSNWTGHERVSFLCPGSTVAPTSSPKQCLKSLEFYKKLPDVFTQIQSDISCNASVNSTCAQPHPGQLRGICPPSQSQGWGICKCCTARGPGIYQAPGQSRAFDMHTVSYQNITTKTVLLEEKQIGSFVKDRNKL